MADRPSGDLLDALAPHRGSAGGTLFRDPAARRNTLGERMPAFERYQSLFFRYGARIDQLLATRAERILVRRGVRPLYATIWGTRVAGHDRALYAAEMANGGDRRSVDQKPKLVSGQPARITTHHAAKTMGAEIVSWRCDCGKLNSRANRCGHAAPWEGREG